MLHLRASALYALGQPDGAFEVFREALAKTSGRDSGLLRAVRYDRAIAYQAVGQTTKARADFEKIFAQDPSYLDVAERLRGQQPSAG
jgi:tetratricopeptide (TPR) repeat protein